MAISWGSHRKVGSRDREGGSLPVAPTFHRKGFDRRSKDTTVGISKNKLR